jgi:hypothetical protein
MNDETKKKYLIVVQPSLWERLKAHREKYNGDSTKVGPVSINNIIETAIKQYLDKVEA